MGIKEVKLKLKWRNLNLIKKNLYISFNKRKYEHINWQIMKVYGINNTSEISKKKKIK